MGMKATKDPAYEAARNRLIPSASAFADSITAGEADTTSNYSRRWSRIFLDEMNRLAIAHRLVDPNLFPSTTKERAFA